MMDVFPKDNSVNLESQMVGEPRLEKFQIKRNEVRGKWIQNYDGKKNPSFTWTILDNLKIRHGIRCVGQIFNYVVVLGSSVTWIKCLFSNSVLGDLKT